MAIEFPNLDKPEQSGYDTFRTPFYKISIASASSSNYIELPEQIAKLISKVEITETQEMCAYNHQVLITFLEGSREPFSPLEEAADSNVYSLGEQGGALTNKTGLIPDLRFNSKGGITGVSVADAASALNAATQLGVSDSTIIAIAEPKKSPKFLFQEFNKVKITWGYLENPALTRTMVTVIYAWQTVFPENGHPETVVTCLGASATYNQLGHAKAVMLRTTDISTVGVDPKTGKVSNGYKALSIKEGIEYVAEKVGIKAYVSSKIDMELPKGSYRVIPKGTNLDKYFTELARETQCYYLPFINPHTDEFSLIFVPKQEYDKQLGITTSNLFTYKAAGSLIKSVNVKADFTGFFGAYNGAVKSGGKAVEATSESGEQLEVQLIDNFLANSSPASNPNPLEIATQAANNLSNGVLTQHAEYNPKATSKQYAKDKSIRDAFCARNRTVAIELTYIGHPKLAPPLSVKLQNIGVRYSGTYKLLTVTHVLDENGYNCRATATNYTLGGTGSSQNNATKGQEESNPQVAVPLISLSSVTSFSSEDPDSIETFKNLVLS
jgi:hypothetical protein